MKFISFLITLCCGYIANSQDTTLVCLTDQLELRSLEALNTKSLEFSPVYYGGGLVFVVSRERNNLLDRKTGMAYFDLMYADVAPDGSLTKPEYFSSKIRTQLHEGPSSFNRTEDEIFFTRSSNKTGTGPDKRKQQVQLKIYHAIKGPEDWEQVKELPFASDEYSIAHPALNAEGNMLVFSSNMPGGFGGMDLYIARRTGNEWTEPENLGQHINSAGNEVFPYWHESGYLFFSSDGLPGQGGLDVFVSAWKEGKFRGLQHLEAPFNSGRDDLGFLVSSDGRSGYIASDRKPTKGKDDLYSWVSSESIFCSPEVYVPLLAGKEFLVTDEEADPISDAYIWLIPMSDEGPSLHRELFNTELVPDQDAPGSFYLRWAITDTLSIETSDDVSGSDGRVKVMVDEAASYAIVVQHNEYLPLVQVIEGKNIPAYLRLKKSQKTPENCFNTLFTVFNEAGNLRLENARVHLTGQCLPQGANIATNKDGNTAYCIPVCATKAEITREGYASHTFTFSPVEEDEHWTIYLKSSAGLTSPTAPIASGTVIVLDNIYYDFNKSAIRQKDAGELNALADVLKQYPDLKIELTSHTDSRGTTEYNMELSRRRSESSKKYLILLGINESRITTKAAGESQPRNHCVDGVECSEQEHQFNRRTEVRIINPAQGMEIKYKG